MSIVQAIWQQLRGNLWLVVGIGLAIGVVIGFLWFAYRQGWLHSLLPRRGGRRNTPPKPGIAYLEGRLTGDVPVYWPLNRPETIIGRGKESSLMIDATMAGAESISRQHARIEREGERYILVDLGSQNGVYVNGQRTHEHVLHAGAIITLGQVQCTFHANPR